ncbi:MAG TPA: hypothetical protein VF595_04065 [Tepidisphaeraceae bacterium]|jgi:hypothetical protein
MPHEPAVRRAIVRAESKLPGKLTTDGKNNPRWKAIFDIGTFVETEPEAVWEFVLRWGKNAHVDVRVAVGCCVLEHLLEYHFDLIFPRVRRAALESPRFAHTFNTCWIFGQTALPKNLVRFERLKRQLNNRERKRAQERKRATASRAG